MVDMGDRRCAKIEKSHEDDYDRQAMEYVLYITEHCIKVKQFLFGIPVFSTKLQKILTKCN